MAEIQLQKVTVNLEVAKEKIQTYERQLEERREELEHLEEELEFARMHEDSLDGALTQAKDEIGRLKSEEQQHEIEVRILCYAWNVTNDGRSMSSRMTLTLRSSNVVKWNKSSVTIRPSSKNS